MKITMLEVTPKAFCEEMRNIASIPSSEAAHIEADKLIVSYLKALGYRDGALIFETMVKWYG